MTGERGQPLIGASRAFSRSGQPRRERAARLAGSLLALAVLTACGVHNLAFRDERGAGIVTPRNEAVVHLPLDLTWTGRGSTAYGVFVDRQPMHPGQGVRTFADDSCKRTAGCPDASYLAQKSIYVVQGHQLRLDALPESAYGHKSGIHEITIVLLNSAGNRIGETYYWSEFTVAGGHSVSG